MGTNAQGGRVWLLSMLEVPGGDVLGLSPVTLGDWYRANGESEHLGRVERALGGEWVATWDLASAAAVSAGFARKALEYLFEEGRAEKRLMGKRWKWRAAG